ncbi:MAG: hypothetical protein J2P48_18645 [Alphaproteobacteria bacterium]|nr:hypothetical protein [Alphaproteobacteria bacterium]
MATRYKNCAVCGNEFAIDQLIGHHHPPRHDKFCSPSCRAQARKKHGTERRFCAWCGTPFAAARSHAQRFCSQHCAGIATSPAGRRPLREPAPEPDDPQPGPVWR